MDLDFDKYCVLDGSPNTVLPSSHHYPKVERQKNKEKPKCENGRLSQKKGFSDISFNRYRSASCNSAPSRTIPLEGHEVRKRGSVYQTSQEVRNMKKLGEVGGRKKIEFPRSSATTFSLGIVDSLCSSDEDSSLLEENRSSIMSLNSETSTSISKPHGSREFLDLTFEPISERDVLSDSFLRISLASRGNDSADNVKRHLVENSKGRCDPAVGPLRDGNRLRERDPSVTLNKSLSAKLALPHSPSHPGSDCSTPNSPKSRLKPIRKMFDPFAKSKLRRNSLSSTTVPAAVVPVDKVSVSRNNTFRTSQLHDFSKKFPDTQYDPQLVKKECNKPPRPCSPAHLRGLLKLESKHGVPFYEFTVKNPEDSFVAKAWKAENTLNWVYTFHKRKGLGSGWGLKDGNKVFSMVGQMQVSCFLCAELKDAKAFDNSIMTEFVLYDIAHARKIVKREVAKPPVGHNETSIEETCKLDDTSDPDRIKLQPKHVSEYGCYPLASADLHPNLEIAAIVIHVPFDKRESLKGKSGDRLLPDLRDLSGTEKRTNCSLPAKVNVVTSSGNHSLPGTGSSGPSRLLDRWKLGGGCDCGGWDMGCPLTVFGNSDIHSAEDHSFVNNKWPWELYVQVSFSTADMILTAILKRFNLKLEINA